MEALQQMPPEVMQGYIQQLINQTLAYSAGEEGEEGEAGARAGAIQVSCTAPFHFHVYVCI